MLNEQELQATHIMLDLETLGTEHDAMIISIGAVAFRFDAAPVPADRFFYTAVDIFSSTGSISPSTVNWWLKQSDEARAPWTNDEPKLQLSAALQNLYTWMKSFNDYNIRVWGNGANFDNVILRNALLRHHVPLPWKYTNDRCFRTMKNILPKIEATRTGTYHNALDDAIYQVNYLQMAVAKVL